MSTIWHGDEVVGETTVGDWGYRVNKSVALGMVRADLAAPGTELQIEIFGKRAKRSCKKMRRFGILTTRVSAPDILTLLDRRH